MGTFYQPSIRPDELYHHGVLGMKWGVHKKRQSYASMTDKQKKRLNRKAERIVKHNNKLSKTMAKNDIKYKDNKYHKAASIVDAAALGIGGAILAPSIGTKAAIATTAAISISKIATGSVNDIPKKQFDKGQNWLKENGFKFSESTIKVSAGSFTKGESYGSKEATQYKLEGRRR